MAAIKEGENGNTAIYSGYEVVTDNERILSVRRFTETSQAATNVENKYDTVDKENEILITLKSLFTDKSYITVISNEIKKQMNEQMEENSSKIYWEKNDVPEEFKQITEDQNFYINSDGKLVIVFEEYEIAPGYMGAVEFVIPTEVISTILVGNMYIH